MISSTGPAIVGYSEGIEMEWENNYPNNHRRVRDGLQHFLRVIGVLSVFGGGISGVVIASIEAPDASQAGTAYMLIAGSLGSGIFTCLVLWGLAAIIDALRIMAANSFKD